MKHFSIIFQYLCASIKMEHSVYKHKYIYKYIFMSNKIVNELRYLLIVLRATQDTKGMCDDSRENIIL